MVMASPHLFDSCPRFALLWMVAKSSITLVFQPIPFMGCENHQLVDFATKIPGFFSWFFMVFHGFFMGFSWFSHGFLMAFPWFSHGFSMVFSWLFHGFSMVFRHPTDPSLSSDYRTSSISSGRTMSLVWRSSSGGPGSVLAGSGAPWVAGPWHGFFGGILMHLIIIRIIIMIYLICLWDFMRCSDVFCCEFLSCGILWVWPGWFHMNSSHKLDWKPL